MSTKTPYTTSHLEIIRTLENAVLRAGLHIEGFKKRRDSVTVEVKSDQSLVLNLDVECQKIILTELASHDSVKVVAEESPESHKLIESEDCFFLVDPLDGTTSCKRFLYEDGGQIGFGPLVGYVHDGVLTATAFYSVPHKTLFSAVRGEGCYKSIFDDNGTCVEAHSRLMVTPGIKLKESGMLFFISPDGESKVVDYFKNNHLVENIYRFGSFASDSARLAQGFEQIQFQLNAKPWDFSGVLLAAEAGCEVFCDPLGRRVPLVDWRIEALNPIAILQKGTKDEFFSLCDKIV